MNANELIKEFFEALNEWKGYRDTYYQRLSKFNFDTMFEEVEHEINLYNRANDAFIKLQEFNDSKDDVK